jgi:hypothetical protein
MPAPFFNVETRAAPPVIVGETRIVPMARSLRIQIPGLPGGLVWNRPVAVVAQTAGGQEQVLPVRDITRQVQLALFSGALLGTLLVWLALRIFREKRNDQKL